MTNQFKKLKLIGTFISCFSLLRLFSFITPLVVLYLLLQKSGASTIEGQLNFCGHIQLILATYFPTVVYKGLLFLDLILIFAFLASGILLINGSKKGLRIAISTILLDIARFSFLRFFTMDSPSVVHSVFMMSELVILFCLQAIYIGLSPKNLN